MPDGIVRAISGPISPETLGERLRDVLVVEVGVSRPWSYGALAAKSGVPEKDIRKQVSGERHLTAAKAFAVLNALGSTAWSRVLAPDGYAVRPAGSGFADGAGALVRAGAVISAIGKALDDGVIDARERAEIGRAARPLIEQLEVIINEGSA